MTRFQSLIRDLVPRVLVLFVLVCLGGFAWLSRYPEAPILKEAESWPWVGPVALWFRELYRPPMPPIRYPDEEQPDGGDLAWAPAPDLPPVGAREIVWVLPGTRLYREPSEASLVIRDFTSIANTIKLERRGDWFRVYFAGSEGWAYLEGYEEGGGPPYGTAPEPTRAMPPRAVDEDALAAARDLLGETRTARVGPYELHTDSGDTELIAYLHRIADQLEPLYEARYGRTALGSPRAVLVLYRSELTYRVLESRSERLAGLHSAGHTFGGLAVFFAGDQSHAAIGATLTHELVHFLNRRAIGPALPPWIDEGLADDLAMARVDPDGRLDPSGLNGERHRRGNQIRVDGGLATLQNLRVAMRDGRLPPLRIFLHFDWDRFVRSEQSQLYYGISAFWVRFLLDGEGGRHAGAFRRFLAGVSEGEPASPEALRELLGMDWVDLDAAFRRWLTAYPPADVLAVPGQDV